MDRRSIVSVTAVVLATGMLLLLTQAKTYAATVSTFTSLQNWQTAVQASSQFSEHFQSFTQDTYFETAAVDVGPFSLVQIGHDPIFGDFRNFIDVPPLQFDDNDGNTNAAMYTKFGVATVDMIFSAPVFAWGANFFDAQSGELESLVLTSSQGSVIATIPVTIDTGFFGVVISPKQEMSKITFESRLSNPDPTVGQGFGLENVTGAYTAASVPEPDSILLLVAGLAGVGSRPYRRAGRLRHTQGS